MYCTACVLVCVCVCVCVSQGLDDAGPAGSQEVPAGMGAQAKKNWKRDKANHERVKKWTKVRM